MSAPTGTAAVSTSAARLLRRESTGGGIGLDPDAARETQSGIEFLAGSVVGICSDVPVRLLPRRGQETVAGGKPRSGAAPGCRKMCGIALEGRQKRFAHKQPVALSGLVRFSLLPGAARSALASRLLSYALPGHGDSKDYFIRNLSPSGA